jgi:type I restriction enzyme M protein
MSDWGGDRLKEDLRWKYGTPPANNANYAWIQHFIHHLAPAGIAGFVMANGSMSTQTAGEGEIRKSIIEADLVDCVIALPGQLFYTTQIPVCLWFVTRKKTADKQKKFRSRCGQTLFIDARRYGRLIDRIHRELTDDEIAEIAGVYHTWRTEGGKYENKPGWWKSTTLEDIQSHGHVLTPGRFVGAEDVEDDGQLFEEKMQKLTAALAEQFKQGAALEKTIKKNLKEIGYEF